MSKEGERRGRIIAFGKLCKGGGGRFFVSIASLRDMNMRAGFLDPPTHLYKRLFLSIRPPGSLCFRLRKKNRNKKLKNVAKYYHADKYGEDYGELNLKISSRRVVVVGRSVVIILYTMKTFFPSVQLHMSVRLFL